MAALLLLLALAQELPARSHPAHARAGTQVRYSPDGKLLLTLGEPDRTVKVWRLDPLQLLHTLAAQAKAFDIRPDGGLVAIAGDDGVSVWNLVDGQRIETLELPRAAAVGWSRDGKTLTTVSRKPGGFAAAAGKLSILIPLARDPAWIGVAPDGLRVAVPHDDTVRVWDLEKDRIAFELPGRASALAFSPDGRRLATTGNKVVRLWEGPKEVAVLEAVYESPPSLAFHRELLLVGAATGVEIWEGGRRRPTLYAGPGTGVWFPASMDLSADGRTLAAVGTLILKDAPASGRVTGPLLFWKLRP